MTNQSYTKLPYDFDLHHDIKSVEALHEYLLRSRDVSTHLLELMALHDIPLPEGFVQPDSLEVRHQKLLDVVRQLHEHAKRYDSNDASVMDTNWVLTTTGAVLADEPGLSDAEREAYREPSAYRSK